MTESLRQMLKKLALSVVYPPATGMIIYPPKQIRGTIAELKAKLPAPIFLALKAIYLRAAAIHKTFEDLGTRGGADSGSRSLYWLDLYGLRKGDSNQPACPEARLINNILTENSRIKP